MTELSLSETARRHGVSKGALSVAVKEERPIRGMSLYKYAQLEDGRITGFRFPDWYEIPDEHEEGETDTRFLMIEELVDEHSTFHRGIVEEAVRQGWEVDGYPVDEWIVYDENGHMKGFEVPESVTFDGGPENVAEEKTAQENATPEREDEEQLPDGKGTGQELLEAAGIVGTVWGGIALLGEILSEEDARR